MEIKSNEKNSPVASDLPPDLDISDIKKKSVQAGSVTLTSRAFGIAIQLSSTVVLARLLSPEDYGLMAMVVAITAFAGIFVDLGLSSAAIQKKNLTQNQQSNLFWLNVALGAVLTICVALFSPLIAWFYGKPELTPVGFALSTTFIIASFGAQHGVLFVRNFEFGKLALVSITSELITAASSIAFALYGMSYWSLVWGRIVGVTCSTMLIFTFSTFRPSRFSRKAGIREMLNFGANVTAFDFVNYFHRNLDNLLLGKFYGTVELGLYQKAYALLMFPISAIRGPINSVAFPALSKLQSSPEAFRLYYRELNLILASLTMPLTTLLAITSRQIIDIVLGPQWTDSANIFLILSIAAFILPIAGTRGVIFLALGKSKCYLVNGLVKAIALTIGFSIGIQWGAIGMAFAYTIITWLVQIVLIPYAVTKTCIRYSDLLVPCLWPGLLSSICAVLVHFLVISKLEDSHSLVIFVASSATYFTLIIAFGLIPSPTRQLIQSLWKKLTSTCRPSRNID